jgi:predicted acyltransferase
MSSTQRYLALDVFRGITIATMIMVNNPGSWSYVYAPLRHAAWHGCTPTDLVFPFFLFIVGVSMFFSFSKYEYRIDGKSLLKIFRRTLLIFVIGLFLNSFPQWTQDFSRLRIMGVLQRIALAYGLGSLIVLSARRNLLPYISVAILLAYWGIMHFLGGTDPWSLEGNAATAFDRMVIGEGHLYRGFGIPFDPEGLLSTIPAIVTVIIGYMAGGLIAGTEKSKVPLRFLLWGAVGIGAGLLWGLVVPINKPLWTSSYVLYTAGWAAVFMAVLIWLIDIRGYKGWTSFFVVFGMNPLFIYALSGVWARVLTRIIKITDGEKVVTGYNWLFTNVFQPIAGDYNGSLLFALSHIAVYWLICYILYKRRIFIKV